MFGQPDTALANQMYKEAKVLWTEQRDYEASNKLLEKAKDIYTEELGEISIEVAQCYRNIGNNHRDLLRFKKSEEYLTKAISIIENLPKIDSLVYARAVGELAITFTEQGNYEKSIVYYGKTGEILEQKLRPDHPNLAVLYYNIGNAHLGKEKHQLALDYFIKALKIDESLGDGVYIASDYDNIALTYQRMGRLDEALDYYNKAIELYVQTIGEEDELISHAMKFKGDCLLQMGKVDESIAVLSRAREIAEKMVGFNNTEVAEILSITGEAYLKKGDFTKAEKAFDQSFQSIKYKVADPLNISEVLQLETLLGLLERKGLFFEAQYKANGNVNTLKSAASIYENAVSIIDTIRFGYREKGSKLDLAKSAEKLIEGGIRTLYNLYQKTPDQSILTNIFKLFEKDKSLLLLESIVEARAESFAGVPEEYLEQASALEAEMAFLEEEKFYEQQAGEDANQSLITTINGQLFDKKQELYKLKQYIEQNYPDYYNLIYNIDVIALETVQQQLLEEGEALVEYFVGAEDSYALIITKNNTELVKIMKGEDTYALVQRLRNGLYGYFLASSLEQNQNAYDRFVQVYNQTAYQIYQKLIQPLEEYNLPKKLIIVPDGVLGYIPFDVLLNETVAEKTLYRNYPFLAKQYNISYSYSGTLLQEFKAKKNKNTGKALLAFAPEFKGNVTDIAGMLERRRDLGNLKFNIPEVEAIGDIFNGTLLLGEEATEENFRALSSDYKIIHLSTHGKANDKVGDYSFLAFTEIKDSLENELIYVRDLYGLELNADMVVLSACETGIGELQEGEGIVSLASGFAYAGAKSIVTTLWSVNDAQTKDIMVRFYQYLDQGLPKNEALYQAKLDYINESPNAKAHPFYWAGYIPLGDMSALQINSGSNSLLWGLALLVLIVLGLGFFLRKKN